MPTAPAQAQDPSHPAELEAFPDDTLWRQMRNYHSDGAAASVDPEHTISHIGLVGNLFTWTAAMRLVEQGKLDLNRMTTVDRARLQSSLQAYLESGGLPDVLKYRELLLLRTLYDDALYRDIATCYRLDDVTAIRELAFYLISNPASLISFNKLKDQFGLGSLNTIKNYISYMKNSWLVFTLNVYDYSVRRQQIAPKNLLYRYWICAQSCCGTAGMWIRDA